MRARDLHIQSPCAADWSQMSGDGPHRFCAHCEKHVHGLSQMTRRQAEALLDSARARRLCVRYLPDAAGRVRFAPKLSAATAPTHQAHGARQLLAAGAALLGLLAAPSARADAPAALEASAPADVDTTLEEQLFDQERRAARTLQPYGLALEEEYLYDKRPDDPQLFISIPVYDPYEYGHMAGGL